MSGLRSERGAAAVEFALILPVLLLILFGIIEYSLAYHDDLSVTAATRAGARTASAQARTTDMPVNTATAVARSVASLRDGAVKELWIYKARTDGKPQSGGFSSCSSNCIKFSYDDDTEKFVTPTGSWPASSQDACAGTAHSVGIYLKVNHAYLSGIFPGTLTLTDHTVMVFEPIPVFQGCR
jgi:hypothetical protein